MSLSSSRNPLRKGRIIDIRPFLSNDVSHIREVTQENFRRLVEWVEANDFIGSSNLTSEPLPGSPAGCGLFFASVNIEPSYVLTNPITVVHNIGKTPTEYIVSSMSWPMEVYCDFPDRALWNQETITVRANSALWPPTPPVVDIQIRFLLMVRRK